MASILLKQVTLYNNPNPVDCTIEDGMVSAIAPEYTSQADQVIDAHGLTLLPGVMDMHVHFRVPGGEHKEDWSTGSSAALAGGVTTVLDMPNNTPAITTRARLEEKILAIERVQPALNYGCYIGATTDNLSEVLASQDIACGVKIAPYFVGQDSRVLIDDPIALRELFTSPLRLPIVIHCEDEGMAVHNRRRITQPTTKNHNTIRSPQAAVSALSRILLAARNTRARLHITHLSTKRELDLLREAKRQGMDITCDVTPHHLTFTADDAAQKGGMFKVNPPLRSREDCDALWQGVCDGTVDMIASDHAPHLVSEKEETSYDGIPPGMPGVETLLPVLLDRVSHTFPLSKLVELTAIAPRKRFSRKPVTVSVGETADLVLADMAAATMIERQMIHSKCGWSPWEGRTLRGKIHTVIRKGQIVDRS
jgi:dihydroorotase